MLPLDESGQMVSEKSEMSIFYFVCLNKDYAYLRSG